MQQIRKQIWSYVDTCVGTDCVGRECKILIMEFFNSLMIVRSLHRMLECSRYASRYHPRLSTCPQHCRHDHLRLSHANKTVDRSWFRSVNNDLQRARCVSHCRHVSSAVGDVWVLSVSEYGSEFVFHSNSEFFVFFSLWTMWLYKEGYCPHVLYHVIDWSIKFLSLSAPRT